MLEIGLKHTSSTVVDATNTAIAIGSGDMEVLATPAMVALMENAAMTAVRNELPEGSTTVGSMISTSHVKPSKMGAKIEATAELVGVEGRKLTFKISAKDEGGVIGEGDHIRYIVDRAKFLSKLQ